jgi:hypothetical protein
VRWGRRRGWDWTPPSKEKPSPLAASSPSVRAAPELRPIVGVLPPSHRTCKSRFSRQAQDECEITHIPLLYTFHVLELNSNLECFFKIQHEIS